MKKLLAGILAVTMLFALTACTNTGGNTGESGKSKKDMTEISANIGSTGKVTMSVPKNDDGTPKYDFTTQAPEGLQKYIVNDTSFYLATDKATFAFGTSGLLYNTSVNYIEKYGEKPASFDNYLEWLNDDEEGQKTKSRYDMEFLEIGGRKAIRFSVTEGSPSNYEYYGYKYLIAYDDIQEGIDLEFYVVYPNNASESEAKELDQEVLDMVNSIKLEKAE